MKKQAVRELSDDQLKEIRGGKASPASEASHKLPKSPVIHHSAPVQPKKPTHHR